jgi:hypothetical protein
LARILSAVASTLQTSPGVIAAIEAQILKGLYSATGAG